MPTLNFNQVIAFIMFSVGVLSSSRYMPGEYLLQAMTGSKFSPIHESLSIIQ